MYESSSFFVVIENAVGISYYQAESHCGRRGGAVRGDLPQAENSASRNLF